MGAGQALSPNETEEDHLPDQGQGQRGRKEEPLAPVWEAFSLISGPCVGPRPGSWHLSLHKTNVESFSSPDAVRDLGPICERWGLGKGGAPLRTSSKVWWG